MHLALSEQCLRLSARRRKASGGGAGSSITKREVQKVDEAIHLVSGRPAARLSSPLTSAGQTNGHFLKAPQRNSHLYEFVCDCRQLDSPAVDKWSEMLGLSLAINLSNGAHSVFIHIWHKPP
jgi:hypothetical protein